MHTFIAVGLLLTAPAEGGVEARWPGFRGGALAGVAVEKGLPDAWSTAKNVAWKTDIPGKGWSSPVVWGDLDGKEIWTRKWGVFPIAFGWGTAASPVLYKDCIYVVNDNEKQSFLTALDKKTGAVIWSSARDEKSNWATPFIWENDKRTE